MAPAKASPDYAREEPRRITSDPVWVVRSATEQDMAYLSTRLTPGSLAELAAVSGCQDHPNCPDCRTLPLLLTDILRKGVIVEKRRQIEAVAVFDLYPIPSDVEADAAFWCALAEEVTQSDGMFALNNHVRAVLDHMNGAHPTIFTYVDARNEPHVSWLESVGFKRVDTVEGVGNAKTPMHVLKRQKVSA